MRRLSAIFVSAALFGLVVAADPPDNPENLRKSTAFNQERLRQQYSAFQQSLLTLAQRLEKSPKQEDRDKAAVLRQAIELASREGVDNQFNKLVSTLTAGGVTLKDLEGAIGQNEQLLKTLREMIAILLSDNQAARLKEEQKKLQALLKMLDAVIRAQKVERSKVESGKGEAESLAKGQHKVTNDTKEVAKAVGKNKDGEPKDGKGGKAGEPKDSEPKDSKGEPKKGGDSKGGTPKSGDGEPKPADPNQPPPSPDEQARKQVQDAIENQKKAEDNIRKEDRPGASKEQDEAIKKLEEMRKEIERRLKQLREEEMERLLANLEARCALMLRLQLEVYDVTKRIDATVRQQPDQKPSRSEMLKSGEQSAKEGQIVIEANKAIQLLQEEGTAVAFPLILEDVRDQMTVVQARLFKTDVGAFTQSIEEDIIASLKDMVAALKKAQKDMKDRQNQPPPPPGGEPPPQRLIDMLAELKMIRTLQLQINNRTKAYATQYPGEQADEPDIRKELQGLAGRQDKVHKVTRDIGSGKNTGQ